MIDKENERSWQAYYEATHAKAGSPLLIRATAHLESPVGLVRALDIACGAGRDTRFLSDLGYAVTAVDPDPAAGEFIARLAHQERIEFVNTRIQRFPFDLRYRIVNAQFALPFIRGADEFNYVVGKIKDSLETGGIFAGQLFGTEDEWNNGIRNMTFHTREQARETVDGLEILEFTEENTTKVTVLGKMKHWHVFHVVARKT